jgi:Cu(I)/Ag(I) efflux system membrane protein CusA/SilA
VGKLGRAETPTDPAPIDMVETIVGLRPKELWPKRKVNYADASREAGRVCRSLVGQGILKPMKDGDQADFSNRIAMSSVARFDREMRQLSARRLREQGPERARELIRLLRGELLGFLKAKGVLKATPGLDDASWVALEDHLVRKYAAPFEEWVLLGDVTQAAKEVLSFLESKGAVESRADLLTEPETLGSNLLEPVLAVAGREKMPLPERWRRSLESKLGGLMADRVKRLSWEIQDRAPGTLVWHLIDDAVKEGRDLGYLAREPSGDELKALRSIEEKTFAKGLFLWRKLKSDLGKEMDSELQFPGWGNIWTQPIINRIDMLATGVRTMIGVKVFGTRLEDAKGEKGIQTLSNEIAAVLKKIPGNADVFPDQIVGENYLEISIDREKAARYGVNADDVQNVIEVALGGKEMTMTIEGRQRFPVRVRYPRDWLEDEEMVKGILVPASPGSMGGMGGDGDAPAGRRPPAALQQVPLSLLTDIKVVPGPSMIKSENGLLRSYVSLNVRDRDIVGFVEEAKRAVEAQVQLPPGYYLEWSGQFEHQMRAQKTLTLIFPLVIFIIFVILYMTYKDLADTLMMFLAVPGAIAGGALFQYIFGYNFSVAVWVGYVACFGLAAETGIVMLVYLREAIDKRGGMARIRSFEEIKEAVIEGAVHRLRPKLLTEGTMILALVPMLWATGVGAEFMRPMAAPILGGILVADEVIDILIPVLFYWERCRRLRNN